MLCMLMLSLPRVVVDYSLIYPLLKQLLQSLFSDYVYLLHLAVTKERKKQVGHEIQYCHQQQLIELDRTELRMQTCEDKLISRKKVRYVVENATHRYSSYVANCSDHGLRKPGFCRRGRRKSIHRIRKWWSWEAQPTMTTLLHL